MDEMRELTFDDMVAGYEFPSVQYEITREQVIKYVEAIGESNPLYIDEEYAAPYEIRVNVAADDIGGREAQALR